MQERIPVRDLSATETEQPGLDLLVKRLPSLVYGLDVQVHAAVGKPLPFVVAIIDPEQSQVVHMGNVHGDANKAILTAALRSLELEQIEPAANTGADPA